MSADNSVARATRRRAEEARRVQAQQAARERVGTARLTRPDPVNGDRKPLPAPTPPARPRWSRRRWLAIIRSAGYEPPEHEGYG